MIDTIAIVISSLLALLVALRATILDVKQRSAAERAQIAPTDGDET